MKGDTMASRMGTVLQRFGWAPAVGALACLLLGQDAAAQAAQANGVTRTLAALEASSGPLKVTRSRATGLATFVRPLSARGIAVPGASGANVEARARAFVSSAGELFGIPTADGVRVRRTSKDELGVEHVRFEQTHAGVPVRGGELLVHLRGAAVVAANGRTLPEVDRVSTTASINATQATATARALVTGKLGVQDPRLTAPRLEIVNPGFLAGALTQTHLAWFIEATGPALREWIWVDAHAGEIVLHFSQLMDARNRQIYTANNTSSYPGTLVRSEGQPATGDGDADAAYDYSGDTYDYFFAEHGRDSYDGAGAALISTVHYCEGGCPYANAFWDGFQMVYGEGFSAADDVDAHELTHAVTEYSAGLIYCLQSGALNESFSDIFGETVDLTNTGGTDTAPVRWLMGEDVPVFGAIRNMMDPTQFDNPGKVSDDEFFCATSCFDFDSGGVHINSGVPNHAYALMVDGGTYNGFTVAGIGLTKAGKIQYRALNNYLTSTSLFVDAYDALQQSCTDLIGTSGITAGDCIEVGKALDAVELGGDICPVCGDGTVASSEDCDDGNTTSGDGCDANCTVTGCGNGIATNGEECDDGNAASGDGCEPDCTLPPGCDLYLSTDVPKFIPDVSSVSSTISIASAATINDVAVVGLNGTHTYLGDLAFVLQSPNGTNVSIIQNVCGSNDNFSLDLSDDAPNPITCPATDGEAHQPSNPLSAFDSGPAGGTWTLTIYDQVGADVGNLYGWGLRICSLGCGNGAIEAGEDCDDGNIGNGDCCSSTCLFEANGAACTLEAQPCGSGTCDGAGTCSGIAPVPAGSECRAAIGACDIAETCDGSSTACPANVFVGAGSACGDPSDSFCTDPDTCDGAGACQPNHVPPLTLCRASTQECDAAEYCDDGVCPTDVPASFGFPCSSDGNQCTDDVCDGAGTCEHFSNFGFCDDGNACTQIDLCDGSDTCVGLDPAVCDDGSVCTVDSCSPVSGCVFDPTPATGCRTAQTATLILKQNGGTGDKQLFKWLKGDALPLTDLADPIGDTEYAVCLYSGASNSMLEKFTLPSGATHWKPVGVKGFSYKDSTAYPEGISKVLLKGSETAGKSKVLVKGRGAYLPDPALTNLPLPVTAQVINPDTGVCVEAVFDSGDVKKNTSSLFKAKTQAP